MISYEPLWKTMENRKITSYALRYKHHIGGGTFQRLKNNETVSTNTIDMLCKILKCRVEDVLLYVED